MAMLGIAGLAAALAPGRRAPAAVLGGHTLHSMIDARHAAGMR